MTDVTVSEQFNQKIDVYSLLPILAVPLNVKVGLSTVTIAVLEVALRERSKGNGAPLAVQLSEHKDFFQETQYLVVQFGEVVKEAYRFVFSKIGDHKWGDFLDFGSSQPVASENEKIAMDSLLDAGNVSNMTAPGSM